MAAQEKNIVYLSNHKTSFRGKAFFPNVAAPDPKYGKLNCNLVIEDTPKNAAKLAELKAACKAEFINLTAWEKPANRKKMSQHGFTRTHTDKEGEEIEGVFLLKAGKSGENRKGEPNSIKVFDKTGRAIVGKAKALWGGSDVAVLVTPTVWFSAAQGGFGMSLSLDGVVVYESAQKGGGGPMSADDYGVEGITFSDEVAEETYDDTKGPTESGPDTGDDTDDMDAAGTDDDIPF
jgi:hypothetical protein